ncbi:transposase [Gottfriedia sp. NPDC058432]|uniref:transposase n=1 Tax=Gottfriedia sp. NPDC058432 TaxID=3346497 RepID=UPI0036559755
MLCSVLSKRKADIKVKLESNNHVKRTFPQIRKKLCEEFFWPRSFCLLITGGSPINVVKR